MSNDDYKVGYGRPPREHQFQPGRSGNSKGRPKGSKSIEARLDDEFNRPVTVRYGARTRKVPLWQAVFMRLGEEALKGDLAAIRQYLALHRGTHPQEEEVEETIEQLTREQRETLARSLQRLMLKEAKDETE